MSQSTKDVKAETDKPLAPAAGLVYGLLFSVVLWVIIGAAVVLSPGCSTGRDTSTKWPWPDWRRLEQVGSTSNLVLYIDPATGFLYSVEVAK